MNAYLWSVTAPVSDNWHDEGALLIVAESLEAARVAWAALHPDWTEATTRAEPDRTWPLAGTQEPEVLVFEDSGCC